MNATPNLQQTLFRGQPGYRVRMTFLNRLYRVGTVVSDENYSALEMAQRLHDSALFWCWRFTRQNLTHFTYGLDFKKLAGEPGLRPARFDDVERLELVLNRHWHLHPDFVDAFPNGGDVNYTLSTFLAKR